MAFCHFICKQKLAIQCTIILKTSSENNIGRCTYAAYTFSPPSCSSYVLFHSPLGLSSESWFPNELESYPFPRIFLEENLCWKFCRLEGSPTGRLESCQIPWDVS